MIKSKNLMIERVSSEQDLVLQGFLSQVDRIKKILIWKKGKRCWTFVENFLDNLMRLSKEKNEIFCQYIFKGRFDKKNPNLNIKSTMVLGDEGGFYMLLNSVHPESEEQQIIEEAGVSKDFLNEKRDPKIWKLVLGERSFGKVRLALSIFGNASVDIGQLVCVKKSHSIGEEKNPRKKINTLGNVTDSCFEDYFVKNLNESVYSPKPLDMAILSSEKIENVHRKAYLVMLKYGILSFKLSLRINSKT